MRPHQSTPAPHMKGDNRRQRETRPLQSPRSWPPTTPHPPHEGRQPETSGDNGRQDHFRAHDGGHTNQHPPPTWRETTGDNGRQRETRPLQSPRSRPHQPTPAPTWRETTGENGRQWETRPLQSPRSQPHQPTPDPHMKGDNRRQWETTGDKTTSEPKKPTTPTNTKAARSKVALRTPTVNCLGKNKQLVVLSGFMEEGTHHICVYTGWCLVLGFGSCFNFALRHLRVRPCCWMPHLQHLDPKTERL